MPAHPKLRSSCDGCGTAKVKCDRTQPECGRCASHGMKCVYGVSRKMGKPPREKIRLRTSPPQPPGHDRLRGGGGGASDLLGPGSKMLDSVYSSFYHPGLHHGHNFADAPYHHPPGHHHGLVAGLHCGGPNAAVEDVLAGWEPLEHDAQHPQQQHHHHAGLGNGSFLADMDALDPLYGDYVDPALPLFVAHDFAAAAADWSLPPDGPAGTAYGVYLAGAPGLAPSFGPLAPELGGDASAGSAATTTRSDSIASSDSSASDSTASDSAASSAASTDSHHDCAREAHDILGSLSPARLGRPPGGAACNAAVVPLDAILQRNRDAGARLARLLACSAGCARAPALALLYASIVARVLAGYQQAAASCAAAAAAAASSWSDGGPPGAPPAPQDATPAPGAAAPMAGASAWDAAVAVVGADGTHHAVLPPDEAPTTAGAGADPLPPAAALGAFGLGDWRVQPGALPTQRLGGEMRRAARLIDRFAAFGASSPSASSSSFSSAASAAAAGGLASSLAAPPSPPAVFAAGGAKNLYVGLEAWLRGEHARVDGLLRVQLRELGY